MSLEERIKVSNFNVEVSPDPDCPNKRLQYRIVSLSKSAASTNEFQEASYPFQIELKRGKVLELREGEEEALRCMDARSKLKVKLLTRRGAVEISFATTSDLHLSRIQLEDPQKHRFGLGTSGTITEKDRWYLPEDAAFSKKAERSCWHVILDKYSQCLFDVSFDD